MKKLKDMFSESLREIRKVPVLAVCAMFAALALVLNSFTIVLGPYIKIGFASIPNQMVDLLFGPITGVMFAGILDIVKSVVNPNSPYFFGTTFNAMLAAFIYGCYYYKKPLTFGRVLAAKATVSFVVNIVLGTLWLSLFYGKAFFVILPARILKNVIMWPIESTIFYVLMRALDRTGVLRTFRTNIVKRNPAKKETSADH